MHRERGDHGKAGAANKFRCSLVIHVAASSWPNGVHENSDTYDTVANCPVVEIFHPRFIVDFLVLWGSAMKAFQ